MSVKLLVGDCRDLLKKIPDNSIDSVVCDPPYELKFMGKKWDASGIAFDVAMWSEVFRVLKPGGHLLAFGGTRTHHRMTCAIEDAEFEIRDELDWLYGSGFPKSLDVSKAIAKRSGGVLRAREAIEFMRARREELGLTRIELEKRIFGRSDGNVRNWEDSISIPTPGLWPSIRTALGLAETPFDEDMERGDVLVGVEDGNFGYQACGERWKQRRDMRAPTTDLAKQWQGWGTALKPGREPIVVARKPFDGTVAQNVQEHGTGALNIDGCRIAHQSDADRASATPQGKTTAKTGALAGGTQHDGDRTEFDRPDTTKGRWPANVILTHSDACELVGTKHVKAAGSSVTGNEPSDLTKHAYGSFEGRNPFVAYGTDGVEEIEAWDCAPDCPVRQLDAQSGISKSSGGKGAASQRTALGGHIYGDYAHDRLGQNAGGIGDSGGASRFFYTAKTSRSERNAGMPEDMLNDHPTVKPIDLMRYLVRLVTPPKGIVLDHFMGSGSTGCAAVLEGFNFIGMDLMEKHKTIAEYRINYWQTAPPIKRKPTRRKTVPVVSDIPSLPI